MTKGARSNCRLSWVIALTGALFASQNRANAEDEMTSRARISREQRTDEQRARDWGLRAEDWARYRQLQQGPLGIYSPNLDPLTALGIEARNDEERRRYAELQVRAESARVAKELAYQRAYDQAWQRLYPTLLPVTLPPATSSPGRQRRIALFVEDNCVRCDAQVKQLHHANTEMDVYLVGSANDDLRLRRWAQRLAVDPQRVRERRITLNHDAGRWAALGLSGDLPALVREVNGQWQRQ